MQTGLCVSNAEYWIEADEWPIGLKSSQKKVQFGNKRATATPFETYSRKSL